MTLNAEAVRAARYKALVKPKIGYFDHREHLPLIDPAFLDAFRQEEWNDIIDFLADAANKQPFCDPTFWQNHERHSFVQWLRSWKV